MGLAGVAGNRQITLNWAPVIGAASYNIWRSTNNGASYQEIATGLTATSYVDVRTLVGQTYSYEVAAANGVGASVNSGPAAIFLAAPQLSAGNSGNHSFSLSWPAWASGWALDYATNLQPPTLWHPVTNAIGSNDGQFSATLPANSAQSYFRLTAP